MSDFEFLQNPTSKKWVILAPRRADRPDVAKGEEVCPFCAMDDNTSDVHILPNKFPFAPIHEIIIHSPDHHKNFGELPKEQVELIFKTYRERYNMYKDKGQVYIFHNRGEAAGESLPHPHTQLTVVPNNVKMEMPSLQNQKSKHEFRTFVIPSDPAKLGSRGISLNPNAVIRDPSTQPVPSAVEGVGMTAAKLVSKVKSEMERVEIKYFDLLCPETSRWPDEVWVVPKERGKLFGEIRDEEIKDLSHILTRLVQIFNLREGNEFPFNFYIYPGKDWYLRFIPRAKVLGGFEIGTGIFINTTDPRETIAFIKEYFEKP